MKGLDYIRVVSDIAFDNDLEFRSDAAFRTYIELIATSAYDLTDGKILLSRVRKVCNTPDLDAAILELEAEKFLRIRGDLLLIPNYKNYQRTRAETVRLREETRERVTRYRRSSNSDVTEQSKSKSKSKKEDGREDDPLLALALAEIPASESTAEDYQKVIDSHRGRLTDGHIEQIICQLAGWKPPKPRAKWHLTLRNWLAREPEDQKSPVASMASPYDSPPVPDDWR
jgi:hypothetical protein